MTNTEKNNTQNQALNEEKPPTQEVSQEIDNGVEIPKGIQQQSQNRPNAFQIFLANGASTGPVKTQIKALGCRYNDAADKWSCPMPSQPQVEELLKSNKIKAECKPFNDCHFEKSRNGQKADNLYTTIGFKQEKLKKDATQLAIDEQALEKEIFNHGLSEDSQDVIAKRKNIEDRKNKEKDDREKIQNLQNQAQLYENSEKEIHSAMKKIDPDSIDGDEIDSGNDNTDLTKIKDKARASARRRALMQQQTAADIALAIQKQYPTLHDHALDIAIKAIEWAKKHQPKCEVEVGGIPKTIVDMEYLHTKFAQLEAPGQPCVIINRVDAQPISTKDFTQRLSGDVVLVGVDDKGQPKYVDASKYWTGNTHKHIYKKIAFTNQEVGDDTYNLFTGFAVKPEKGNCEKILNHIKEVICASNEGNYEAFIKLLAWQIKNIGKPSRIIVALKSKAQQVGKGCLLENIMAVIYGNAGIKTSDTGQIITRFNDTIRSKAFIFLDEALFAGDRKAADAVKSLATTTIQQIESKGIPTVQFPIAVNLFLATNHDDAAHVEESDARYWILEVSPHKAKNFGYFTALYSEIDNGGREAFMWYLLNEVSVTDFVPARDVPIDNAFKDAMIRNSINPYDARKWLEACCNSRMIIGQKPIAPDGKLCFNSSLTWESWEAGTKFDNAMFFTAYAEWQKTVRSAVGPRPTSQNKFGELLTAAGLEPGRTSSARWRILPDPDECLRAVISMIDKVGK